MNNSDVETPSRTERPTSELELGHFPNRLKLALDGRSMREFAFRSGVSPSVLRSYLRGESEPTRPALVSMAVAAGVNVAWLAIGEEPMRKGQVTETPNATADATDWETLEEVIAGIEMIIGYEQRPMQPRHKAALIRELYRYYMDKGSQEGGLSAEDKAVVMDIIKAALRAGGTNESESESRGVME